MRTSYWIQVFEQSSLRVGFKEGMSVWVPFGSTELVDVNAWASCASGVVPRSVVLVLRSPSSGFEAGTGVMTYRVSVPVGDTATAVLLGVRTVGNGESAKHCGATD